MQSLLKMLPSMIRLSGDNEEVREQAVFTAWRVVAGRQVSYNCAPFRLYRKNLIVAAVDEGWKKQMERLSHGIIFRLNSMLGAPLVTYIEFRVDRRHVEESRREGPQEFDFRHTRELAEELRPAAEQIKNDALREAFLRAAAKCLERRGE
jgi:hypothetical protein